MRVRAFFEERREELIDRRGAVEELRGDVLRAAQQHKVNIRVNCVSEAECTRVRLGNNTRAPVSHAQNTLL